MELKDMDLLEDALPLFNIRDKDVRRAITDIHGAEDINDDELKSSAAEEKTSKPAPAYFQTTQDYKPKWSTSRRDDQDDESSDEESLASNVSIDDLDDLPIFADDECRELSRQIKMFERKRDEAAKNAKEHLDRVSLMKDHLHNVRQEIVHTNGLLAAKNKEIATEKHLIALANREKLAALAEIKEANQAIKDEKEEIRSLQSQIYFVNEQVDKLKLSLNWNQEELEQWATAAAKKESDNLALEKYKRADEVKIKELTLKLENLTKLSVEKQAELENEKTETHSKQLEIDRITKLFKADHEERRQLVEQWQKTVQAMKERDAEINRISVKYREATESFDDQLLQISAKKEELYHLKVRTFS